MKEQGIVMRNKIRSYRGLHAGEWLSAISPGYREYSGIKEHIIGALPSVEAMRRRKN